MNASSCLLQAGPARQAEHPAMSPTLQALLARALPHSVLLALLPQPAEEILQRAAGVSLGDLLDMAQEQVRSGRAAHPSILSTLRDALEMRVDEILPDSAAKERRRLRKILGSVLKTTMLRDYLEGDGADEIEWLRQGAADIFRVAAALEGDETAFEILKEQYGALVIGRIRSYPLRAPAGELEKRVWNLVRKDLSSFQPAAEPLESFIQNCVDSACRGEEFFIKLYAEASGQIQRYVRSNHLFRFDESSARDVEQNAWKMIWEQLPQYNPKIGSGIQFAMNLASLAIRRAVPRRAAPEELKVWSGYSSPYPVEPREVPPNGSAASACPPDVRLWMNEREARSRSEALDVLRDSLADCSRPHLNLAFACNVVLQMFPLEMVERFWAVPFAALAAHFRNSLAETYSFTASDIRALLLPLQKSLVAQQRALETWQRCAPDAELIAKASHKLETRRGAVWQELPKEARISALNNQRADEIRKWVCTVMKRVNRA